MRNERPRSRSAGARAAVVVASISAILLPARVAGAAPAITLDASATTITIGQTVTLTVDVSPPAAQPVAILGAGGTQIASGTTDASTGRFVVAISPRATVTLHAVSGANASADVVVAVRAVVHVRLGAVRLFDRVSVTGSVRPAGAGEHVQVVLTRAGRVVATHRPTTGSAGRYRSSFPVRRPGTYRVRARFADATHLAGTDLDGPQTTPLPRLHAGSRGIFVSLLERRLVQLHYRLVGVDRSFDFRTADAVMAFRKVQRMARTNAVDAAVWRALADPVQPHPRASTKGFHIEVDQTRQVLYTVDDGRITNILHVSTGKPSTPTPDGSFFVSRKIAGYSPHLLYYPSYFDGNRAIHGWPDVPSYPASHGCVRVPFWNAKWIYGLAALGTRVLVYHE